MPTIICTADLSQYLIGAEDKEDNFYNIYSDDKSKRLVALSLEQAKRMLRELGVEKVMVEMRNPYDEMIGTENYGPVRMLVTLG